MNSVKKELMNELKGIWNNKDFVCGAMSNAGSEENWNKMLNYIRNSNELGEQVTSDEILLMSLDLSRNNESDKDESEIRIAMV